MQTSPSLTSTLPGPLSARFEPLRVLGRGGLGEVLAARDRLLGREVALKLLRPDRTPEQGRLAEEFALLASLHHPGVVDVLDAGVADGVVYLVTALIEGDRLDAWLERDPTEAEVAAVLGDLLATLGWLHDHGVVHADVKPANVLLLPGGGRPWPVLIDFGLARSGETAGPGGGTPTYMAPELRRGARHDASTDLYALGRSFQAWAERHPDAVTTAVLDALTAPSRSARLASADEAIEALLGQPGVGTRRRLGTRGRAAMWGAVVSDLSARVTAGPGALWARLPDADDAAGLLEALKTSLQAAGVPAVVLPVGGDHERWSRLVACVAPGEAPVKAPTAAPEAQRDLLEVWALGLAKRLRARADAPALLVAAPERLGLAGRLALARVLESGAVSRVVLAGGPAQGLGLGPGAEAALTRVDVSAPDAASVRELLKALGVEEAPPSEIEASLVARAAAGVEALRLWLEVLADGGILAWADGAWRWAATADVGALDAPDLDGLWARLWRRLPAQARLVVRRLAHLGGVAHRDELAEAAGEGLRDVLARLMAEGWVTAEGAALALRSGPLERLGDRRLELEGPTQDERRALAAAIEARPGPAARDRARAGHLGALGRHVEAAEAWTQLARARAAALEIAEAGEAALEAAGAWRAAGRLERALEAAAQAVRWLELAARAEALEQALALAREVATALGSPEARLAALQLEARVAVHLGRVEAAVAAVDAAERLEGASADARTRLDLALARGTALAQAGRHGAAMAALSAAAYQAEVLEDRHAIGRVSNSLGIAAFHAGAFLDAAEAWERAARAKRDTGDLRGARIAESNRGLALRELGRLGEAVEAAWRALEAAGEMGDRRGQAMGHLGLAQAWLDVGEAARAAEALEAFERLPVASELVRADAEVLRVRLALVRGEPGEAAERAERLLAAADAGGLATIAREVWPLAYLARLKAGRPRAGAEDRDEARRRAEAAEGDAGAEACLVHAMARVGAWDEARVRLAIATRGLTLGPVPPGRVLATELLAAAARLVGEEATAGLLTAALGATDEDRRRTAAGYGLARDVQTPEDAAEHSARSADTAQPLEVSSVPSFATAPSPSLAAAPVEATASGWPALPHGRWADLDAWAATLREVAGAVGCALVQVEGLEAPAVVGRDGEVGGEARWVELVPGLVRERAPFAAGPAGRLEAFGAPVALSNAGQPVGAAFLTWKPAAVATAETMARALSAPLGLAAVAMDRQRLQGALEEAQAEEERRARRHRKEVTALREALEQSRTEVGLSGAYEGIVHRSAGMRRVLRTLDKVTATDVTVLLLGESGVGKELLARAVHDEGGRRAGPFVVENCGAVPADLFESVFFGHVKGAFTGATGPSRGLVEAARGGTLFLDEVGELRPDHQVKLLRVLQERRYRPVGGTREVDADFRLVAATNRDLEQMVRDGSFREDLYYRLAVVTVKVPPLRERRDDILPIASRLLTRLAAPGSEPASLAPEAVDALVAYDWPGNVRELENELLRATVLSSGRTVRLAHLSPRVARRGEGSESQPRGAGRAGRRSAAAAAAAGPAELWDGQASLADVVGEVEREVLTRALEACGGRKAATARRLGLSRPGLDAKMARHGLDEVALRARMAARPGRDAGEEER